MKRSYQARGRVRRLEQLEGIVAVLPEGAPPEGRAPGVTSDFAALTRAELYEAAQRRDLPGRSRMSKEELVAALERADAHGGADAVRRVGPPVAAGAPALGAVAEERAAFEAAGWSFVTPAAATEEAARLGEPVAAEGVREVRPVYRDEGGRLLIGTRRMIVRLAPELSGERARALLEARGLAIERQLRLAPNLFEVRVPAGTDPLEFANALTEDASVVYAEPEFLEHIPPRWLPTDPDFGEQWHLRNTGQESAPGPRCGPGGVQDDPDPLPGGTAGADVAAEAAWDVTRGLGVRVAVIDNGFDVAHEDLAAGIAGAAFFQNTPTGSQLVQGTAGYPVTRHGTFCAGLAAARANNGRGGCGVANQATLVPIACLSDQVGTQTTLARALAYAADPSQEVAGADPADGADVIACSLGPNGATWAMTNVLQDAVDFVVANGRGGLGAPIFWAVTNGNFQIQTDQVCAYANTIAVSRSTRDDLHDNAGFGPELDFVATGVDVYSTRDGDRYNTCTGTSFAAPVAAGVGALVVAVAPQLAWDEVRDLMRDTCDQVGGVAYDDAGRHARYGSGRVNAARAVCQALRQVELETASIVFNDVPAGEYAVRAVAVRVTGCAPATLQVVAGPTVLSGPGTFGTLATGGEALPAIGAPQTRHARWWLLHQGTADGDVTMGEITVRVVETGDQWTVPISANTVARRTVAAALALDQSGSMQWSSGIPGLPTRNDVLRFAAPAFATVMPEGNGIGIVAFDHQVVPRMALKRVGPIGSIDLVRAEALGVLSTHLPNPVGLTAIGSAVEACHGLVAAASDYDERALVVFTDGFENRPKYIADVAHLIGDRVFAIALGTAAQIKPSALTALTNGTGGYLLLTGAVNADNVFLLNKYFLQVLAGVTNHDVVLDPEGYVAPGQKHRIAFDLTEADTGMDAIVVSMAPPEVLRFALETPQGDIVDPGALSGLPTSGFAAGTGVSFYRTTLPLPVGAGAGPGRWHALLTVDERYYRHYLEKHGKQLAVAAHGVRYSLSVHASSGVRLSAALAQSGFEPGASLMLRATLREYGLPIGADRANVRAEVARPDGSTGVIALAATNDGAFEGGLVAAHAGHYAFRVLADGATLRGRPFTREHLLSGAVWVGGDRSPPTGVGPDADRERLCRLVHCLLDGGALSERLQKRLAELGVDLRALRRCLAVACRPAVSEVAEGYGRLPDAPSPSRPTFGLATGPFREEDVSRALDDVLAVLGPEVGGALRVLVARLER